MLRSSLIAAAALLSAVAPLAARAADGCGILSAQQLSVATQDSVKSGSGVNGDCIWSGKHSTIYISVRDSGTWASAKASFKKYGQIQTVSGVGDDAFFMGPDNPKPTFYALKGAHFIILRVNVSGFSNDQTKAALQTLASQALSHL